MEKGMFSHIKPAGKDIENTIINEFVEKYGEKYPHMRKGDFEIFVRGTVGNYFSEEGIRNWMEKTIPALSPEVLNNLKKEGLEGFLYSETHLVGEGYTPLSERFNCST